MSKISPELRGSLAAYRSAGRMLLDGTWFLGPCSRPALAQVRYATVCLQQQDLDDLM